MVGTFSRCDSELASAYYLEIGELTNIFNSPALITASSSGVYIAIYILIMVAHLKYRKSKDFMADGYLMPQYRLLNPLKIDKASYFS